MPSPGTSRPSSRVASGAVKPSMIPKIHTSAATLMTSGTVTKKPAMKLPPQPLHHAQLQPSPEQAARMRRRQPRSGTRRTAQSPTRRTNRRNGLDDRRGADERHHEADADLDRALGRQLVHVDLPAARSRTPRSSSASPERTRTPRPPRGRAPSASPPTIVAPERDTPGISASVWHTPISKRVGVRSRRPRAGARVPTRSTSSMTTPPTCNATAMTAGVEHRLDEVGEQQRPATSAGSTPTTISAPARTAARRGPSGEHRRITPATSRR